MEEGLWEDVGKGEKTRERQSHGDRRSARGVLGVNGAVNEAGDRGDVISASAFSAGWTLLVSRPAQLFEAAVLELSWWDTGGGRTPIRGDGYRHHRLEGATMANRTHVPLGLCLRASQHLPRLSMRCCCPVPGGQQLTETMAWS